MHLTKIVAGAFALAALMFVGATGSMAASALSHPEPIAIKKAPGAEKAIVVAQNRNRRRRRRNRAVVGGVIAGAIGAAILANEAARAAERRREREYDEDRYDERRERRRERSSDRRAGGDAYDRCADKFKSFRYSDGTYQPYDSDFRRRCPYL